MSHNTENQVQQVDAPIEKNCTKLRKKIFMFN